MPWGPSQKERFDDVIGVILRTPGLFIIDYWWQYQKNHFYFENKTNFIANFATHIALINGFFLLLLPLSCVRCFYVHLLCGAMLLITYFLSYNYVHKSEGYQQDYNEENMIKKVASTVHISENSSQISILAVHVFVTIIASLLLRIIQRPILPIFACYYLPVVAQIVDFPSESIEVLHNFSSALVIISLIRYGYDCFPNFLSSIKLAFETLLSQTQVDGLYQVLYTIATKLFVPTHFLLFWVIAFIFKLYENSTDFQNQNWYIILLGAASNLCTTPVSLISTSVMVAYVSYFTLYAIKIYLSESNDKIDFQFNSNQNIFHQAHSGWEEGLTTLLLALVSGITKLKQSARMAIFTLILFVVLNSILQSMLEIVEPVVLSLSAFQGRNIFYRLKIFLLCAFLFLFPLHVTWILAHIFPIDFWMAIVFSSSLLTSAQVLDLVIVHSLVLYDTVRKEPWEYLDEVIYYVRGATKFIEFILASSVVIVGLWEGLTNQWKWSDAFILFVHCYFNVIQRLHFGYSSFVKRQKVLKKSSSLPSPTRDQLIKNNDVCAICYIEMINEKESVVIQCNHFYHKICLRRWLCFQERCPLCFAPVILDSNANEKQSTN